MSALAGRVPDYVLVHTAVPVSYEDSDEITWVEGEPGAAASAEPVQGVAFACCLFLPSAGGNQDTTYRPRTIRTPTLLYNPTRTTIRAGLVTDGSPIVVRAEDELLITAPELAPWCGGEETARWLAAGEAQPAGPPGQVFVVIQTLRMVED